MAESKNRNSFLLAPPDKFSPKERHLYTRVKFALGGKKPVYLTCELSRKHFVKEVINHLLILYK